MSALSMSFGIFFMRWRFMNPFCVYRSVLAKMPTTSGCQPVSSRNSLTYSLVRARLHRCVPGRQTDREEGRGGAFARFAVLLDEVPHVVLVLPPHMDGSPDDHRLAPLRLDTAGEFLDVQRLCLAASISNHLRDVPRDSGRLSLGGSATLNRGQAARSAPGTSQAALPLFLLGRAYRLRPNRK